ncbi:MAG: aerobic carbon-monoxide dehydrogenase medium subunit [bacterium]|nr:aerobic carbon-monoxide dehydrogenase medium subunit [bacterium]
MLFFQNEFEYIAPKSLERLFSLLSEEEGAVVFAGGTDLFVRIKKGILSPKLVLDLKRIEELWFFSFGEDMLVIGATNTLNELIESPIVRKLFPLIYECSFSVANYLVRNKATFIGNFCTGFPVADTLFCLLLHDAEIEVQSLKGIRKVKIKDIVENYGRVVLERGEIVTRVFVPYKGEYRGKYYRIPRKFCVTRADFGIAYMITEEEKRIVFGDTGSGLTLLDSEEGLEEYLNKKGIEEPEICLLVEKVLEEIKFQNACSEA